MTEFLATGLTSKNYEVQLEGIGLENILVTKGNLISVLFLETFLSIDLNDLNPFVFEDKIVWLDPNNDVWVGVIEHED